MATRHHSQCCLIILVASTFLTLLWYHRTRKYLSFDFGDLKEEKNQADSKLLEMSTAESFGQNVTSKLHVIIQFPVLNVTSELIEARSEEYLSTLQRNLGHPQVLKVHLLQESNVITTKRFLENRNIQHMDKLVYFHLGRRMLYTDAFKYASNKLLDKNVVIMHSDCYLEDGFERLDPLLLRRGLVYALSRHAPEKSNHCQGAHSNKCLDYSGSHDAFVFHLTRRLPKLFLTTVHFYPNVLGAENTLIYYLKRHAGFRIKNPCKILRVMHNHCSGYRAKRLARLDRMLGVLEYARPSSL